MARNACSESPTFLGWARTADAANAADAAEATDSAARRAAGRRGPFPPAALPPAAPRRVRALVGCRLRADGGTFESAALLNSFATGFFIFRSDERHMARGGKKFRWGRAVDNAATPTRNSATGPRPQRIPSPCACAPGLLASGRVRKPAEELRREISPRHTQGCCRPLIPNGNPSSAILPLDVSRVRATPDTSNRPASCAASNFSEKPPRRPVADTLPPVPRHSTGPGTLADPLPSRLAGPGRRDDGRRAGEKISGETAARGRWTHPGESTRAARAGSGRPVRVASARRPETWRDGTNQSGAGRDPRVRPRDACTDLSPLPTSLLA